MRFIGVDGPRWFLRAMLAGAPALDDEQAQPFLDTFRGTVVVRGNEPLPVREPVPLQLPQEAAEQIAAEQAAAGRPIRPSSRTEPVSASVRTRSCGSGPASRSWPRWAAGRAP